MKTFELAIINTNGFQNITVLLFLLTITKDTHLFKTGDGRGGLFIYNQNEKKKETKVFSGIFFLKDYNKGRVLSRPHSSENFVNLY